MHCRSLFVLTLTLWSASALLLPRAVRAEVPLTSAVVQDLRNQVRLFLKNQIPRPAQRSDKMTPGDALATDRSALAELRFNDRSLARVGEQTLFRFQPNTRSFSLSNGTLLLVIPPGQGATRVRTPNAAAGIRGSALFVRYNPDTNTTLVGALTNSQIEVSNQDKSQNQVLKAGQMAVITQNRIERVYDFDLNTFYETSELTRGLDLPRRNATAHPDPAIAAVQLETAEAIRAQAPLVGQGIVDTPAFVRLASQTAVNSVPPVALSVPDRTMFTGISPLTGVASELRRLASGKQNPAESGTQGVVTASPVLTSLPSVAVSMPTLTVGTIGASPAPLPSNPNPPAAPAIPTSGLPTLPTPDPAAPPPPAPAPLPPATIVVQPPVATPPETPVIVGQPPTPAPAPLPPATAVIIVQPPVVEPPTAAVVVQPSVSLPPATAIVQPPTPAPAPLPPAVVVQPPAPAPAPLPPASAIVVQPPVAAPAPSPIAVPPVQASPVPAVPSFPAVPVAAPAPTPEVPPAASAIVTTTPPINSVPITPPTTDSPPIVPAANPVVQPAPVPAPTTGVVLEISPASAKVTPLSIK